MPPRTRRNQSARTASSSQQSTLSFHGKQNRVTKASQPTDTKKTKQDPALTRTDFPAESAPDLAEPTTAEKAIQRQTKEEITALEEAAADPLQQDGAVTRAEDVLGGRAPESDAGAVGGQGGAGWVGDEEAQARKITDTQIKRYWRAKEQERKTPRVHQEDLGVYEKVLREWDMSGQYGKPCIGIARLKRWKRANLLGLNPPIEVLAVLLKELEGSDAKARAKSQRAYVDELMSSRFIET